MAPKKKSTRLAEAVAAEWVGKPPTHIREFHHIETDTKLAVTCYQYYLQAAAFAADLQNSMVEVFVYGFRLGIGVLLHAQSGLLCGAALPWRFFSRKS